MSKEFKDYDKKYAAYKGKWFDYELEHQKDIQERAKELTHLNRQIKIYSNAEIREAVYFSAGAEDWQKFRVSQKGFDTNTKLARLEYRFSTYNTKFMLWEIDAREWQDEQIRIDNYVGALVRGGQLNSDYGVVR